jgi:transcriptional regulator with PAS, ATPase and Fis domain
MADESNPWGKADATEEVQDSDGPLGWRLLIIGPSSVRSVTLPDRGVLTIGRAEPAQLVLEDRSISRCHVEIEVSAAQGLTLSLRDLGSSNGTRLRGERIASNSVSDFAPGEVIEIGKTLLVVQRGGEPVAQQPVPRAPESRDALADSEARVMDRLRELIDRIAPTDISILILGETGVGKEVTAKRVHARSARSGDPFLALNCGALSDALLESELFGHEKGAFTGAAATKKGLLEMAQGGTVFLDEIGEMPKALQVKFLRVLEDRQVRRVGGLDARRIDVRFVSATHRDLDQLVHAGDFRQDLFYRLNGISLFIPPLRERKSEILPLAEAFARGAADRNGRPSPEITPPARERLLKHAWPGNIRELRNVIDRAVALSSDGPIDVEHLIDLGRATLPPSRDEPPEAPLLPDALKEVERRRILEALDRCGGNQSRAAELLGISRKVLMTRLDAYGITRPRKGRS